MEMQTPEVAFHQWLVESLGRALRAFRADDANLDHLARSVDHADLKRRMLMHHFFR
jgi:hypothetical protein